MGLVFQDSLSPHNKLHFLENTWKITFIREQKISWGEGHQMEGRKGNGRGGGGEEKIWMKVPW